MSYQIIFQDELYHHGIKGQRWGVRRFMNPDGSLTEAGRKRYRSDNNRSNIRNYNTDIKRINRDVLKYSIKDARKINKTVRKYKNDPIAMYSVINKIQASQKQSSKAGAERQRVQSLVDNAIKMGYDVKPKEYKRTVINIGKNKVEGISRFSTYRESSMKIIKKR